MYTHTRRQCRSTSNNVVLHPVCRKRCVDLHACRSARTKYTGAWHCTKAVETFTADLLDLIIAAKAPNDACPGSSLCTNILSSLEIMTHRKTETASGPDTFLHNKKKPTVLAQSVVRKTSGQSIAQETLSSIFFSFNISIGPQASPFMEKQKEETFFIKYLLSADPSRP